MAPNILRVLVHLLPMCFTNSTSLLSCSFENPSVFSVFAQKMYCLPKNKDFRPFTRMSLMLSEDQHITATKRNKMSMQFLVLLRDGFVHAVSATGQVRWSRRIGSQPLDVTNNTSSFTSTLDSDSLMCQLYRKKNYQTQLLPHFINQPNMCYTDESHGGDRRENGSRRFVPGIDGQIFYKSEEGYLTPLPLHVRDVVFHSPFSTPLFPAIYFVGKRESLVDILDFNNGEMNNPLAKHSNISSFNPNDDSFHGKLRIGQTRWVVKAMDVIHHVEKWRLEWRELTPIMNFGENEKPNNDSLPYHKVLSSKKRKKDVYGSNGPDSTVDVSSKDLTSSQIPMALKDHLGLDHFSVNLHDSEGDHVTLYLNKENLLISQRVFEEASQKKGLAAKGRTSGSVSFRFCSVISAVYAIEPESAGSDTLNLKPLIDLRHIKNDRGGLISPDFLEKTSKNPKDFCMLSSYGSYGEELIVLDNDLSWMNEGGNFCGVRALRKNPKGGRVTSQPSASGTCGMNGGNSCGFLSLDSVVDPKGKLKDGLRKASGFLSVNGPVWIWLSYGRRTLGVRWMSLDVFLLSVYKVLFHLVLELMVCVGMLVMLRKGWEILVWMTSRGLICLEFVYGCFSDFLEMFGWRVFRQRCAVCWKKKKRKSGIKGRAGPDELNRSTALVVYSTPYSSASREGASPGIGVEGWKGKSLLPFYHTVCVSWRSVKRFTGRHHVLIEREVYQRWEGLERERRGCLAYNIGEYVGGDGGRKSLEQRGWLMENFFRGEGKSEWKVEAMDGFFPFLLRSQGGLRVRERREMDDVCSGGHMSRWSVDSPKTLDTERGAHVGLRRKMTDGDAGEFSSEARKCRKKVRLDSSTVDQGVDVHFGGFATCETVWKKSCSVKSWWAGKLVRNQGVLEYRRRSYALYPYEDLATDEDQSMQWRFKEKSLLDKLEEDKKKDKIVGLKRRKRPRVDTLEGDRQFLEHLGWSTRVGRESEVVEHEKAEKSPMQMSVGRWVGEGNALVPFKMNPERSDGKVTRSEKSRSNGEPFLKEESVYDEHDGVKVKGVCPKEVLASTGGSCGSVWWSKRLAVHVTEEGRAMDESLTLPPPMFSVCDGLGENPTGIKQVKQFRSRGWRRRKTLVDVSGKSGTPRGGVSSVLCHPLSDPGLPSASPRCQTLIPRDSVLAAFVDNGRFYRTFTDIHMIGKGGFGSVYHVRHRFEPNAPEYAVKFVSLRLKASENISSRRYFREVSANRDLFSRQVVRYFTWWCEEPQFLPQDPNLTSRGAYRDATHVKPVHGKVPKRKTSRHSTHRKKRRQGFSRPKAEEEAPSRFPTCSVVSRRSTVNGGGRRYLSGGVRRKGYVKRRGRLKGTKQDTLKRTGPPKAYKRRVMKGGFLSSWLSRTEEEKTISCDTYGESGKEGDMGWIPFSSSFSSETSGLSGQKDSARALAICLPPKISTSQLTSRVSSRHHMGAKKVTEKDSVVERQRGSGNGFNGCAGVYPLEKRRMESQERCRHGARRRYTGLSRLVSCCSRHLEVFQLKHYPRRCCSNHSTLGAQTLRQRTLTSIRFHQLAWLLSRPRCFTEQVCQPPPPVEEAALRGSSKKHLLWKKDQHSTAADPSTATNFIVFEDSFTNPEETSVLCDHGGHTRRRRGQEPDGETMEGHKSRVAGTYRRRRLRFMRREKRQPGKKKTKRQESSGQEDTRFAVTLLIQMELVSGMTLREWLDRTERESDAERLVARFTTSHGSCGQEALAFEEGRGRVGAELKDGETCCGDLNKSLKPTELILFRQLVKGLKDIHTHGIVHRDIKPENIFVEDSHLALKIGDFGLARFVEAKTISSKTSFEDLRNANGMNRPNSGTSTEQQKDSVVSVKGLVIGTPGYTAPEGGALCTEKADIFSASLILLELLCPRFSTAMERYKTLENFRSNQKIPEHITLYFPYWAELMRKMGQLDPRERPSALMVYNSIKVGLQNFVSPGAFGPTLVKPLKPSKESSLNVAQFTHGHRVSREKDTTPQDSST